MSIVFSKYVSCAYRKWSRVFAAIQNEHICNETLYEIFQIVSIKKFTINVFIQSYFYIMIRLSVDF